MNRFYLLFVLVCIFAATPAKAQILPSADTTKSVAAYVPGGTNLTVAAFDDKAERQYKAGKALLITGGALTVSGVALYTGGLLCMGEGGPLPSSMTISGVTCAGLSVGCYVAGSILYCKGKRSRVRAVPGGLALNF